VKDLHQIILTVTILLAVSGSILDDISDVKTFGVARGNNQVLCLNFITIVTTIGLLYICMQFVKDLVLIVLKADGLFYQYIRWVYRSFHNITPL
jgi:hypothetical protein